MSVTGVYLPSIDFVLDCYKKHMKELEKVISESQLLGPVTALGDFSAHLGGWECQQNLRGILLQEMLGKCELSAVSEGVLVSGPGYTYCSSDLRATVDYFLMDFEAAFMMKSCCTHPMEDLTTQTIFH